MCDHHTPAANPAMAQVLGRRNLLGFGVLLAWLVLFHLLVNIWLLCMLTSLLVVLGGWLGSQAVLESNNVVHLERFITFKQVTVQIPVALSLSVSQSLPTKPFLNFRFQLLRRMSNTWMRRSTTP